jgi:solute carrier family 35
MSEAIELWMFGTAYAVFSSTLLVANKWALSWIAAPNFLMFLQSVATCVVVYVVAATMQKPVALTNPVGSRETASWFFLCVFLQFITIGANMMSLHLIGVDRVILLRVFAMFPIAIGDWLFNNRHLPSANSWTCFACLGAAVFFVFGSEHESLSLGGVGWGLAYFVFITTDQVLLKRFTKAVVMNDSDRTFWMNLFGAPIAVVAFFITGESKSASLWELSPSMVSSIALSCILGSGISFTAWGLRRRASAVTFSLIGVVCKIGSMGLNFLFLEHLSPASLLIITLGIVSTYFYEQAPERTSERVPPTPTKTSGSKWLIVLVVIILFTGFGQLLRLQKYNDLSIEITLRQSTNDKTLSLSNESTHSVFCTYYIKFY